MGGCGILLHGFLDLWQVFLKVLEGRLPMQVDDPLWREVYVASSSLQQHIFAQMLHAISKWQAIALFARHLCKGYARLSGSSLVPSAIKTCGGSRLAAARRLKWLMHPLIVALELLQIALEH
jgi:hypothetical protein